MTRPVATKNPGGRLRARFSTGLLLLAPVATAVTVALLWNRLPDPMPSHWDTHGAVDDTMPRILFTMLFLLGSALTAGIGTAIVRSARSDRARSSIAVIMGFLAWLFCGIAVSTTVVAAGVNDPYAASQPTWVLLLVSISPVLPAVLLYGALPRQVATVGTGSGPVLDLTAGERAVWLGRARSRVLLLIGSGITLLGAGLMFVHPPTGVPTLVVGLVLVGTHRITVRADHRGVRVCWGPQRWPRHTYRLDTVTGAEVIEIDPSQWGGWGYRISGRGVGIVMRRGSGLLLHREGRTDVAITVDDPGGAAAVVNTLAPRADAPSEGR